MNKNFFILVICIILTGSAFSQIVDQEYLRKAKKGDNEAMHLIAFSYEDANMMDSAVYWYTKAAQAGNLFAQSKLGEYYEKLEEPDYKKSFYWYQKSAAQGYSWAQYKIGHFYHYGQGVEVNDKLAAQWLKSAAEQGYSYGLPQYEYGKYYAEKEESKYWLLMSAKEGYEEALTAIGEGYQNGVIGKNADSAYSYFLSAATKGSANAKWYLSECYALGEGCEQSYWHALGLYYQAAQNGSYLLTLDKIVNASNTNAYEYNPETQQKELKADASYYWYKDLIYNDNIESGYKIMQSYAVGSYGVQQNADEAINWCDALAKAGLLEAQVYLAHTFESIEDIENAKYWYEQGTKSTEYMKSETSYEKYLDLKKECQEALVRLSK